MSEGTLRFAFPKSSFKNPEFSFAEFLFASYILFSSVTPESVLYFIKRFEIIICWSSPAINLIGMTHPFWQLLLYLSLR